MQQLHEEFVGEPLAPEAGTFATAAMSHGEPGLPESFTWRDQRYSIRGLIRKWKTSSPCRNGSDELYLRRHWYQVLTEPAAVMTLYCDRQAKDRKHPKARWWVFSVAPAEEPNAKDSTVP